MNEKSEYTVINLESNHDHVNYVLQNGEISPKISYGDSFKFQP